MPKMKPERNAAVFIRNKCTEMVGKKGTFLGYVRDVSEDGKVMVIGFYVPTGKTDAAVSFKVIDRDVIRAVINPDTVPYPEKKEPKSK